MSTRIIVKNIPKKIKEDELKKHFSAKGDITDIKIMKKPNGESRNFCFIGFKTEKSAKDAVKYFNGTYVGTVKVSVEIAKAQNDPTLVKKGKSSKKDSSGIVEVEDKESKIKKILELSKETKNADKFDKAAQDKNNKNSDKEEDSTTKEDNKDNKEAKEPKTQEDSNTKKLNPKRLYLKNLPFQISEDEIRSQFEKYGSITEVHIPINHKTNESFGYAYITYETVDSSVMALSKMDGEFFQGRRLHISIAEEKYSKPVTQQPRTDQSSFKAKKYSQLKRNYNNETNWNYLFLNQNAVIETISNRLNIPKEEILSKESADIAVQIAAMETSIINETKEWLKGEGINLDLLKGKRADCIRSKNIIFVKNISSKVSKDVLEKLFSRYGSLVRFIVSPSNTLAVCEYVNGKHAQNCMKHLAYYELEGEPLYLEFAPEGIITKEEKLEEKENEEEKEDEIDLVNNNSKILFISNLNFSTTEKQLKKFFESKDYHVSKCEIAKHLKDNRQVSSGYGFVEFKDEKSAVNALKNLNNRLLGGHSVKLSISKTSEKKEDQKMLNKKRKNETELNDYEYENENISNTKLLIKNLAFEATKEELRKLFKEFGQVKTVRLPMKLDGTHRGFAFIEFMSHEEAQKAFKELQNTHFYGRKIVIEWAQQEKTVEEIRESTQRKANAINIQTHRKQKKGEAHFK